MDRASNRPVALVSNISKVLEMVLVKQLDEYMRDNKLWHPNQHAYQQGMSTLTALLTLHEEWLLAMD